MTRRAWRAGCVWCVCRAGRSSRDGCRGAQTGSAAEWPEAVPAPGEVPPCLCLALVSEDPGLSRRRLLAAPRASVPSHRAFVLQSSLDVTETFKQQKSKLVQEAFHPDASQDPLFFLHAAQEDYVPLNASLYHSIVSGEIPF